MSVATHSPLLGSKRLFGEDCSNVVEHRALDDPWGAAAAAAAAAGFAQHHQHHPQHPFKKVRRCSAVSGSPGGVERCVPSASPSGASALQYLSGLYPRMDQKVISTVLDECGDNIEAAIKRLEDLQLFEDSQCTNEEAAAEASAAATAAATTTEQTLDQVSPPPEATAGGASSPAARSAEEWVQVVVSEMASATDMEDAQARAARVLQSFEGQVQTAERRAVSKEIAALHAQVAELARGNTILKKAVQIQNTRMQDVTDKEAQLAALQQALAQQQEKIRILELSNYSLNMHLRQAASNPMPQHRHPDVF